MKPNFVCGRRRGETSTVFEFVARGCVNRYRPPGRSSHNHLVPTRVESYHQNCGECKVLEDVKISEGPTSVAFLNDWDPLLSCYT